MTNTPSPTPEEMTIVTIQVPGRRSLKIEGKVPESYARRRGLDDVELLRYIARGLMEFADLHTLRTIWREVNDGA